jgi:hypothetical protein
MFNTPMKTILLTVAIIASLIPIGLTTMPIVAFASTDDVEEDDPPGNPDDKSNAFGGGEKGLCQADESIHRERGFPSETDDRFHGQDITGRTLEDNPGGVDEGGFDVQDFLEECEHLQD